MDQSGPFHSFISLSVSSFIRKQCNSVVDLFSNLRQPINPHKLAMPGQWYDEPAPGECAFRFLDLSLDIKLTIYRYLIPTPPSVLDARYEHDDDPDDPTTKLRKNEFQTCKNLLMTCRQLSIKLSPLFYQYCTFVFSDPIEFANEFLRYLPDYKILRMRQLRWEIRYSNENHERYLMKGKELTMLYKELKCLPSFEIHYRRSHKHEYAPGSLIEESMHLVHDGDDRYWYLDDKIERKLMYSTFRGFQIHTGPGRVVDTFTDQMGRTYYNGIGSRTVFLKL